MAFSLLPPINLHGWIEEHRHLLKPPVCNQVVYQDSDFMIMVVGGPNSRKDFHINQTEEFFYQIEGDMVLRIRTGQKFEEITIRQGEIMLLPSHIPHSPQRFQDTVGLVIERKRSPGQLDGFVWYCPQCHTKVYDEFFQLVNIVDQLPPLFERFYGSPELATCKSCHTLVQNN